MRGSRGLVVHVRYGSTDEMLNADMAQKVNRSISGQLAINSRRLTVYGSGRRRVKKWSSPHSGRLAICSAGIPRYSGSLYRGYLA